MRGAVFALLLLALGSAIYAIVIATPNIAAHPYSSSADDTFRNVGLIADVVMPILAIVYGSLTSYRVARFSRIVDTKFGRSFGAGLTVIAVIVFASDFVAAVFSANVPVPISVAEVWMPLTSDGANVLQPGLAIADAVILAVVYVVIAAWAGHQFGEARVAKTTLPGLAKPANLPFAKAKTPRFAKNSLKNRNDPPAPPTSAKNEPSGRTSRGGSLADDLAAVATPVLS